MVSWPCLTTHDPPPRCGVLPFWGTHAATNSFA